MINILEHKAPRSSFFLTILAKAEMYRTVFNKYIYMFFFPINIGQECIKLSYTFIVNILHSNYWNHVLGLNHCQCLTEMFCWTLVIFVDCDWWPAFFLLCPWLCLFLLPYELNSSLKSSNRGSRPRLCTKFDVSDGVRSDSISRSRGWLCSYSAGSSPVIFLTSSSKSIWSIWSNKHHCLCSFSWDGTGIGMMEHSVTGTWVTHDVSDDQNML